MVKEKIKSRLIPMAFVNVLLVVSILFVTTATGGCVEADNSGYREGATMRNEIIEYVKSVIDSGGKGSQIDVTHLVEKYIRIGDSYETSKVILLNNGFSVYEYSAEEARNRKDVRIAYRIGASYKMEGSWWYRRDIQIFLGKSPQSERVDEILAKVNLKTL